MLIYLLFISLLGFEESAKLSIQIESKFKEVVTISYNGVSSSRPLSVGLNSLEFDLSGVNRLEDIESFKIQFKQLNKKNRVKIHSIKISTNQNDYIYSGRDLYKMFNENYFIEKFIENEFLVLSLHRYWARPAILLLNDKFSIPTSIRNHIQLKIKGKKPGRSLFSVLYYTTENGSFTISKYFNKDSLIFDIYTEKNLLNFNLFLGDYENKITIEEVSITINDSSARFQGQSILDNFGFNHFIFPNLNDDIVELDIQQYKGRTYPLLTYRAKNSSTINAQNTQYTIDIFGYVSKSDDILEFVVSNKSKDVLRKRILIKNDSISHFHLEYLVVSQQPIIGLELMLKNQENTYLIDSIIITSNEKKRVFDSGYIASKFTKRNLTISELGQIEHVQANTSYASLYYETDFIFLEDRVKNILKYLAAFILSITVFLKVNKYYLKRVSI